MAEGNKYLTISELCRLGRISRLRAVYLGITGRLKVYNGANGEWMFDNDDARMYFHLPGGSQGNSQIPVSSSPSVKNTAIILDEHQKVAMTLIEQGESLFITGKAGTGKTVLLNEIRKRFKGKKYVATVAPTGVAAENANGFTMHSFFMLPLKPYLPGYEVKPELYKLKGESADILKKLDVILLDEVSMVRCDMMDAMDMILRHYRGIDKPFGGVQMVMFGDLYQLCPVTLDDEKEELEYHYDTLYFFSSKGLNEMDYRVVSLEHIHRQDEHDFIDLLNNIRVGKITVNDLNTLDSHFEPGFAPGVYDDTITLMTHNRKVWSFNRNMYEKLSGEERVYDAVTEGYFRDTLPAERHLGLKVGARVMFLRNDNKNHQYVNGTTGRVTKLGYDSVTVRKDDGAEVEVTRATWEQLDYHVDSIKKAIYTTVSARYKQIPLKLAWAVSIHKSQGLTFDEALIDAEKAFTYGQVYVALSRVRTLKGVHLLSKISSQKIKADSVVQSYMESISDDGKILADTFKPKEEIIDDTLSIDVKYDKYLRIKNGETTFFKRSITNEEMAQKIFLYKNGKICINDIFKDDKREWTYKDTNNGHCPFIVRKYKKVNFYTDARYHPCTVWVTGDIEVYVNKGGNWSFQFRFQ